MDVMDFSMYVSVVSGFFVWRNKCLKILGLNHGLNLIPARIINYFHYNVWDEITYPLLNFNSATIEDWEWVS